MLALAALALLQLPQPMPAPAMLPDADSAIWIELHAAPAVWERERFGTRRMADEALEFNRRHQAWIDGELEYETDPRRQSILYDWDRENKACHRAWWYLACSYGFSEGYEWRARLELSYLRDAIGAESFGAGEMPPAVPVWRFRELKP